METYTIFIRTWWRVNTEGNWPNDLEPYPGEKEIVETGLSLDEARLACREYNESNDPGELSRKMEFESE